MEISILTQNNHLLINKSVLDLVTTLHHFGLRVTVFRTSATAKGKSTGKFKSAVDLYKNFGPVFLLQSLGLYFKSYFSRPDNKLKKICRIVDIADDVKLDSAVFKAHCTEFNALLILSGTRIIKKDVLDLWTHGVINVHSSILPYARGLMPALWTYLDGKGMGVTLFKLDEGIDTGEIIYQAPLAIRTNTYLEHLVRTKDIGTNLLVCWVLQHLVRIDKKNPIEDTYNKYPAAGIRIRTL